MTHAGCWWGPDASPLSGPLKSIHTASDATGKLRGLMWERAVSHSIRPDGFDGFVLPYQELLALAERDGTIDPSEFVAFAPDEGFEAFSNVAEHVNHDLAIASLLSLADKVRVIAKHIPGAWDRHLEWISERLSELWQLRGAFPGLGSALHAFEIRYGTLLAMDLAQRYCVDGRWAEDPWALVLRAFEKPNGVLSPRSPRRYSRSTGNGSPLCQASGWRCWSCCHGSA